MAAAGRSASCPVEATLSLLRYRLGEGAVRAVPGDDVAAMRGQAPGPPVQPAIEVQVGSTTFRLDDWNFNIVVSD